jgi:hypothetical protein
LLYPLSPLDFFPKPKHVVSFFLAILSGTADPMVYCASQLADFFTQLPFEFVTVELGHLPLPDAMKRSGHSYSGNHLSQIKSSRTQSNPA